MELVTMSLELINNNPELKKLKNGKYEKFKLLLTDDVIENFEKYRPLTCYMR